MKKNVETHYLKYRRKFNKQYKFPYIYTDLFDEILFLKVLENFYKVENKKPYIEIFSISKNFNINKLIKLIRKILPEAKIQKNNYFVLIKLKKLVIILTKNNKVYKHNLICKSKPVYICIRPYLFKHACLEFLIKK